MPLPIRVPGSRGRRRGGEGEIETRCAEETIARTLGICAELAFSTAPAPLASLTPGELAEPGSRRPGPARLDWLRGRAALKALLPPGYDTSGLLFPHRAISLTHAGGLAVAVRAHDSCEGIGIDFEPWHAGVGPRAAQLFLGPSEQAKTQGPDALVRLWTIKEALYKATPGNRGCLLLDFEVIDPAATSGEASGPRGERLRYAALRLGRGSLAIAVCGDHHQALVERA